MISKGFFFAQCLPWPARGYLFLAVLLLSAHFPLLLFLQSFPIPLSRLSGDKKKIFAVPSFSPTFGILSITPILSHPQPIFLSHPLSFISPCCSSSRSFTHLPPQTTQFPLSLSFASPLFPLQKSAYCTVGQNNQEFRLKYWATRSSVRLFARTAHSLNLLRTARFARAFRCAHSFARSLTSLTFSLMGQ